LSGIPDPALPGDEPLSPDGEEEELDLDIPQDEEGEPEEAEAPELEAETEPEPRRERRSSATIRQLRERAQRAEAERDIYRSQASQPQRPPAPDPQANQQRLDAEYQRIAMLLPEQQAAEYHRMMQREVALARLESFDMQDRSNFQRMQEQYPAARRLAAEVEQVLSAQRAQGIFNFSREQIFDYLLGRETRTRSGDAARRQRRDGQARVARQTVRPGGQTRGDMNGRATSNRGMDADERLLRSTRIDEL